MKVKHYNEAFEKISEEKKNRILKTAIAEFAIHGYESANVNTIAEKANVSVGSIYKYFDNKQNLYLTVVDFSVETLKTILYQVISNEVDFLSKVEKIIRAIQSFSREKTYLTKLYNQMTAENNSEFLWKTVSDMEGVTADLYASFVSEAQKNEYARKDINPRYFAFFMDNIFMLLQFSYSCEYYRERFKMFIGEDVFEDDDLLVEQLLKFIKGALYLK